MRSDYCPVANEPCQCMCVADGDGECRLRKKAQTPPPRLTDAFIQATRETHWRKGELERAIETAVRAQFGVQE